DAVVLRGLCRNPGARYATALEMAVALEAALPPAPAREVGAWLQRIAGPVLADRAERVREIEAGGEILAPPPHVRPPSSPSIAPRIPQAPVERVTLTAAQPLVEDAARIGAELLEAVTMEGEPALPAAPPPSAPSPVTPPPRTGARRPALMAGAGLALLLAIG